ncbi:MAG: SBBP repeat-containing protein [Spirosomataceae bacterium]
MRSMGGASFDVGYGIAVDGSGNIYLTGSYQDTATFGSTKVLTSVGSYDVFIAQYSSSGLIQWVRSVGGASFDSGYSIAVDGSSNVYVTGSYQGTATFGSTILTSVGSEDVFVAQYNSSGSIQWVKSGGGTISDIGKDIAVDELGNVYVTGSYYGAAFFGETTLASAGGG